MNELRDAALSFLDSLDEMVMSGKQMERYRRLAEAIEEGEFASEPHAAFVDGFDRNHPILTLVDDVVLSRGDRLWTRPPIRLTESHIDDALQAVEHFRARVEPDLSPDSSKSDNLLIAEFLNQLIFGEQK